MSNRAERRRAERGKRKGTDILTIGMARDAVRAGLQEHSERQRVRNEAIMMASGPIVKAIYAGVISVLSENYGFTGEQCLDVLTRLDEKAALCMDSEEMTEEAFQKTGIRVRLDNMVERVERMDR